MIIAIEGPDGCGKSTLIKKLVGLTGIPEIRHKSFVEGKDRDGASERDAYVQMDTFIPISSVFTFFRDRHLMSNLVYNTLYGPGPLLQYYWELYQTVLKQTEILIIYLNVPFVLLCSRLKQREQAGGCEREEILSKLVEIKQTYELVYTTLHSKYPNKIVAVDGAGTVEEIANTIWAILKERGIS